MKLRADLISYPMTTLSPFASLIGSDEVNDVDALSIQPLDKFIEATSYLLLDREDAWKHLTLIFAFEAPIILMTELINFHEIKVISSADGFVTCGLLTSSFYDMRRLIKFLTDRDDLCDAFAKLLTSKLSMFSYFQESHKWLSVRPE